MLLFTIYFTASIEAQKKVADSTYPIKIEKWIHPLLPFGLDMPERECRKGSPYAHIGIR